MEQFFTQLSNKVNNLINIFVEHRENKYKLSLRNLTPKVIVGPDEGFFYLFLDDSENKESAILRSNEYQLLHSIKTAMVIKVIYIVLTLGRLKKTSCQYWTSSCCSNS